MSIFGGMDRMGEWRFHGNIYLSIYHYQKLVSSTKYLLLLFHIFTFPYLYRKDINYLSIYFIGEC